MMLHRNEGGNWKCWTTFSCKLLVSSPKSFHLWKRMDSFWLPFREKTTTRKTWCRGRSMRSFIKRYLKTFDSSVMNFWANWTRKGICVIEESTLTAKQCIMSHTCRDLNLVQTSSLISFGFSWATIFRISLTIGCTLLQTPLNLFSWPGNSSSRLWRGFCQSPLVTRRPFMANFHVVRSSWFTSCMLPALFNCVLESTKGFMFKFSIQLNLQMRYSEDNFSWD